mgnify:CR=1 FL=1
MLSNAISESRIQLESRFKGKQTKHIMAQHEYFGRKESETSTELQGPKFRILKPLQNFKVKKLKKRKRGTCDDLGAILNGGMPPRRTGGVP